MALKPSDSPLNIVIFGIGAMGTLFASRLETVASVTLFGQWSEQIETIRHQGLTVTHLDGRRSHHNRFKMTNTINELPFPSVIIVLAKSYQTERVAHQIAHYLDLQSSNDESQAHHLADPFVITLQNGLGNAEYLAQVIDERQIVSGTTAQGATLTAPGQLRHAGEGLTALATQPDNKNSVEEIANLFNLA
ncbi:MAG: 2-dehydropantoate 2-reductase, partial [Chloroflexota bacterium]